MKHSFTAVLERNVTFTDTLVTEPYEVAWAREARVFVRALDLAGRLEASAEISPDGLFWMPEGTPPVAIQQAGLLSFPLREFGHWLRLALRVTGPAPSARVIVYLALKE
ncbi:MAG: hypothetical protein HZC55_10090 [Verrucomicrobia bacterium]|nr:hypothetical protein [Verrucomicrobiota bacterium]